MAELVGPRLYSCCNCRNHVSLHDDVVSKAFQGRHGRAFLFSHAMNIVVGPKEDRNLTTGLHTVADISCADCQEVLGWKYERAYEFILYRNLSTNSDCRLSLVVHPCIVPCIKDGIGIRYETPSFRLNGRKQMEKKLRTW
ncbi:PROTEIN YIPPEE-LIKE [Salix purpurea]|uniref:Protein yippee-like n=1 Tax=Salix purpurea TaxID=77065 RepID=A0A9Q0ZVR8_SALPP|nr:PROTEIN YIPPEE-LIKE [Salix purpurea]